MQGEPVLRGEKPQAAAACGAPHARQERQPARTKRCERVRVFVGPQRGFVHESAHDEVGEQQPPELLAHQVRGFAAQHDLLPTQVRLQLDQRALDPPALSYSCLGAWRLTQPIGQGKPERMVTLLSKQDDPEGFDH
jgi:hypothetical protein